MTNKKEQLEKIRKESIANLDKALEILGSMEENKSLPDKKGNRKSELLLYKTYYHDEYIADYKQEPYEICLLLKHFIVRRTPKGRILFETKKDVMSIKGNTHIEIGKKIDEETLKMDGCIEGEWNGKWIPEEIKELLEALRKIKI